MTNLEIEIAAYLLFFIGVYGLIARRNIIKSIISIGIMEAAIILYMLTAGRDINSIPPILPGAVEKMADPIPQALTITAIVIGVAVTAVALSMFLYLYQKFGTTNWEKAKAMRLEGDRR